LTDVKLLIGYMLNIYYIIFRVIVPHRNIFNFFLIKKSLN